MSFDKDKFNEVCKKLQGLNINQTADRKIYEEEQQKLISREEETRLHVYDDGQPHKHLAAGDKIIGTRTAGTGFNMGRKNDDADIARARKEWEKAFEDLPQKDRPSFDRVRNAEADLTPAQANKLLAHSISVREQDLKTGPYKNFIDNLNPMSALALKMPIITAKAWLPIIPKPARRQLF
jgi:hypothetical protein